MISLPESLFSAAMPAFRLLDAETAHGLAIRALAAGLVKVSRQPDDPALAVRSLGCLFSNPIGLAAGFDKDALAIEPLAELGFGFVEAGTVTASAAKRQSQATPIPARTRPGRHQPHGLQ